MGGGVGVVVLVAVTLSEVLVDAGGWVAESFCCGVVDVRTRGGGACKGWHAVPNRIKRQRREVQILFMGGYCSIKTIAGRFWDIILTSNL